ncbi:MAG TPA: acyltransferase, partial [Rhodospirillum rubrum]|nr:acyltransferase [Rhodospirillum rubrum]
MCIRDSYYTPRSYERKGAVRYLADRLLRLGAPLLAFFFVLYPLTVAIARTSQGHPFWRGWGEMIVARAFGPGPLWFAEALLICAVGYAAWRGVRRGHEAPTSPLPALPSTRALALTAVGLGVASFAVRLAVPVGKDVLWLQLGYVPCYLYLFAAGCRTARSRLLERITAQDARPWMIVSAIAIFLLPIVMLTRSDAGAFEGGWTLNAFFYALWDPFVAWGVILGLLWAARRREAQRRTPLTDWLGRGAFGAFIVHPPVVVALSVWAATWSTSPWAKFALVGAGACAGSYAISAALRLVPGVRRVI